MKPAATSITSTPSSDKFSEWSLGGATPGAVEGYFNEHWQYNALNQLAEIDTSAQSGGFPESSATPGTANVFFTRYNFSATQSGANIAYMYDALKRLTKATTTSWTQNIGYDGFRNITSKDVPTGSAEPTFPGAVSSKNWLTGVSYDLNENALAVNAFALAYDAKNRLATATSGSAVEATPTMNPIADWRRRLERRITCTSTDRVESCCRFERYRRRDLRAWLRTGFILGDCCSDRRERWARRMCRR